MRRTDREITDENRIDEIIRTCKICRLGFCDEGEVYIVPLNFGYECESGRRVFYFHGASEGRKLELIRKTGKAGFEMDCGYEPISGETACTHSSRYRSIIGSGTVRLLEDREEKKRGMLSIMAHITGKRDWELPEAAMNATAVFRLEVEKLSCKERK